MITTNGAGEQPQDQGGTSSKNAASPVTLVTADQIDAIVRGARPIRFCDSAAIKPDSITIGKPDCHEEIVTRLYHKRHHYAVYLTEPPGKPDDGKAPGKPDEGKRPVRNRLNRLLLGWSTYFGYGTRLQAYRAVQKIRVTYSVDKEQADKQIKHTIGLGPRRIHIMNLVDQDHVPEKCKHTYFEQIAEALKVGLEEEISTAEKILDEVKSDVLGVLEQRGRIQYLKWAAAFAILSSLILMGWSRVESVNSIRLLLMATGAGAIGALYSIARAIRGRTVVIYSERLENEIDAALRVLIGIISAAVVFLIFDAGFLKGLQLNGVNISGEHMTWQAALLVGFLAGFLERLVPDLLEKKDPDGTHPTAR